MEQLERDIEVTSTELSQLEFQVEQREAKVRHLTSTEKALHRELAAAQSDTDRVEGRLNVFKAAMADGLF